MIHNIVKPRRRAKRKGITKRAGSKIETSNLCLHCGGMLKIDGDWKNCVMCGRLADHQCQNCGDYEVAA